MFRTTPSRRLFHLFLTVMLIALLAMPVTSFATSKAHPVSTSLQEESPKQIQKKISKRLESQFDKEKHVTFLIKFKEQADTKQAAAKATQLAKKQKQSAAQTRLMKRSAVVSELRATALETQREVKSLLNKRKKSGDVKEFESFYIVNAMAITGTKEVMEELAKLPEVDKLLPNETRKLGPATTQKGSKNTHKEGKGNTTSIEWNIDRVGAPAVWNLGIDGTGTVVANIDTGVQWDHPALKEQYQGYNPNDPNNPNHDFSWFDAVSGRTVPYDDNGHGTHTIGTMVGAEPDGSNQIGVAPGAKWIAVKAFTAAGSASDQSLLAAGEWILAPKDAAGNPHPEKAPDVVNNSWGGSSGMDEWYLPMVQNWREADIFPEFSAGNSGPGSGTVNTPANYPDSFATGATDRNDLVTSFSSRGPSPYGEIKPEIVAPGAGIRSAIPGGGYASYNGTSMAGPHASAAIALLRQANASLSVDDMEQILMETATPRTDSQYPESPNNGYGHGLLNVFDAVSAVQSGVGTVEGVVVKEGEDNEPPQYQHQAPAETYEGMPLPLQIDVQDNVSIDKVELQYRSTEEGDWTTIEAKKISGDHRAGTYGATVPADAVELPKLYYRWQITDYGKNNVTSDVYELQVKEGISIGYFEDFESTPTGWSSFGDNNSWQWGAPTSGPGEAYSGEKVYGTNLEGDYANNANMTLVMPPIDLPEGNAYLQFKQWYNLERNWDYGHVFVSTDRENWTQLSRFTDLSNGWIDGEVNLSEYAGQRIYVGFNVTTDFSVTRPGLYLDDVRLSDTPLETNQTRQIQQEMDKLSALEKAKGTKKKGKTVNPNTIKPSKQVHVQYPFAGNNKTAKKVKALPLEATVSVLETGRSVATNPANGSYSLRHAAGSYTLRAEAYGYRSADQQVNIENNEITEASFQLDPIPQGVIHGTVTNKATGEPVSGATLLLMEDAAIQPVQTDEKGNYTITAYEGTYTLKVLASQYHSQEVQVTVSGDKTTEVEIELRPFIGYPDEIGYDDGTAENARAFFDAGNGWAVKMSLADGEEQAMISAGLFRFWDTEWPVPGGTRFQVAIYDASGSDGAPGKKIAGPFDATAKRDGTWTRVDLSDQGIMVDGDFYMVYIQTDPNPYAPGLATDENGPNAGRSWQLVGGSWGKSPSSEGNYMIRAQVDYEVTVPTITSPTDGLFTNQSQVTVEGNSAPSVDIHIYNGKDEVATTQTNEKGSFSVEIPLKKGENSITATASTDLGATEASAPVKVVLDQENPSLSIASPTDGLKTNREAITIEGQATDDHLDWIKVNNNKATVKEDGSFSYRLALESGENRIKVVAQDKAGNITEQTITVHAKFTAPTIEKVKPDKDVHLKAGRTSVQVEFHSEAELASATFVIHLPLVDGSGSSPKLQLHELTMTEVSPGRYVGFWAAPKKMKVNGAAVEVRAKDAYGNSSSKMAEGKLYIK